MRSSAAKRLSDAVVSDSELTQDPYGLLADGDARRMLRVLLEQTERHRRILRRPAHISSCDQKSKEACKLRKWCQVADTDSSHQHVCDTLMQPLISFACL